MGNRKLFGFLTVLGLMAFVVAGWHYQQVQQWLSTGIVVPGKVISVERRQTRVNKDMETIQYHPIFVYKNQDGDSYTVVSEKSTGFRNQYRASPDIHVWYQKGKEKQARIFDFYDVWLWPLGWGIVMLLFFSLAGACYAPITRKSLEGDNSTPAVEA